MKKPPIGVWRVQPLPPEPRVEYATPHTRPLRTVSGFGVASLALSIVVAMTTALSYVFLEWWDGHKSDLLAMITLPLCLTAMGVALAGIIRRDKRRTPGLLGVLLSLASAMGVAWLWLLHHLPFS